MLTKLAYAYYEAGAAVAAAHLKLTVKQVSINAARGGTDIVIPRDGVKARITLWLTALAAEKKGVGETDAFRRMKNRQRIRAELDADASSKSQKAKASNAILSQAQDRANAICSTHFAAIRAVAERLVVEEALDGETVEQIVAESRKSRLREDPQT